MNRHYCVVCKYLELAFAVGSQQISVVECPVVKIFFLLLNQLCNKEHRLL